MQWTIGCGSLLAIAACLAADIALADDAAPAGPAVYEATFKPLHSSERRYAILGPAGPFYPQAAISGTSVATGEALLECRENGAGELDRCKVLQARPYKFFGLAALAMARQKRIVVDGGPADGQTVRVHVPFDPSTPAQVAP